LTDVRSECFVTEAPF